jgi:hypothetical protein
MIEVFKIINDIYMYDPLTTVDMFELNTTSIQGDIARR